MKSKKMVSAGLTLAFGVVALAGCATTAKVTPPQKAAETAPAAAQAPAAAPAAPVTSGKVIETMNAGGYTYLSVEKDGKQGWVAIPETKVAVGDEVTIIPGIDMANFSSSTLKRTFPTIHFSAGIQGAAAAAAPKHEGQALPANHPALPKQDAAKAPAAKEAAAPAVISGKVVEAMDAGGYTYLALEKDGTKTWAAIPASEVKVGQDLAIQAGNVMPSFTSKSLNRTFENIIFSPGIATK